MAEMLIRVVDKGIAEDCSKAGDIITAKPDNHPWSVAELSNPDWRIIRVTGILQSTIDALLSKSQIQSVKRRREYQIVFALLPDPSLFVGDRTQQIITLTKAQAVAAVVKK